jgi:hypothetical protein
VHVFPQQGDHGPATASPDIAFKNDTFGVDQTGCRKPLQGFACIAAHEVAAPGAIATNHTASVRVPAYVFSFQVAAIANHTAIERWANAEAPQKPKLENAQALGRRMSFIQPDEKLIEPRENRLLRLSWWTQPVAQFDGVGSVSRLGEIRGQTSAVVENLEGLEDHQIRSGPLAQSRFASGRHAEPA